MKHCWIRKGYLRLLMALGLMVVLQGLYAQTWTWQQQCSSNEWSEICGGTTVCGTNPTTYAYYGNWGTWSCGYNPSALRPGPGSTAIFPSGANALLASSVDIRNVFINNGATLAFTAGTLQLRHPENNAPGTLTVQSGGLFRLPSSSSYRYLGGVVVNTGTLRHEGSGLWWTGASLQSSGTIELLAGNWYNNAGANNAQNTGTVVKRQVDNNTPGTFTLDVPFENSGTVSVEQGELQVSNHISGTNGVWNVASGATLDWIGTGNLSGTHSGTVAGSAYLSSTRTVIAPTTLNLSGNGLAFVSGTLNAGSAGLTNAGVFRLPSSSSYRYLGGVVVNTGTLRHEGSGLWWTGASLQSSGTIELLAGVWYSNAGTNNAQNAHGGKLLKLSSSSFFIDFLVRNAGLIDYREGSLSIGRLVQTDGETRIHAGRTLSLSNPMELQGGKLTGAGTLDANLIASDDGDPATPPATIAPGIDDPDNPSLNPLGILALNGNLTMSQDAVLEIELAGTDNSDPNNPQYDQVRVSRYNAAVQLNGVLRLKGRDGYTPNVGDVFDVILRTASSWNRTGQFRQVEVDPDTLRCMEVAVRYLADRVRVVVVSLERSPDINRDGCVDDSDLLAVLFAFGSSGNSAEDINCDGVVDDGDLLSVLFAFGQGC